MRKFLYLLFVIGIVLAVAVVSEASSITSIKNRSLFLKSMSTFNQALLLSIAMSDKPYTKFNDVWNHAIENLLSPVKIPNGVRFRDMTEVKYKVLKQTCSPRPADEKSIGSDTACAILRFDVNGFAKAPNMRGTSTFDIKDQFNAYLYNDAVEVKYGSYEYQVINSNKLKY